MFFEGGVNTNANLERMFSLLHEERNVHVSHQLALCTQNMKMKEELIEIT